MKKFYASNEVLIRETLKWCNRIRVKQGKKPLKRLPKGRRKDPDSCPCGKTCGLAIYEYGAFRAGVHWREIVFRKVVPIHETNRYVREFIWRFDAGQIPEQEAK